MFQRFQTKHGQADYTLNRLKSGDTLTHPSNTLGSKSFSGLAYNPTGPQRRVVVTKKVP